VKKRICFRADGDPKIGLGHLFRLAALAEKLKSDFHCVLFTCSDPDLIKKTIGDFFQEIHFLTSASLHLEAKELGSKLSRNDILVLDGYPFDTEYQRILKKAGVFLVTMDDYHPYPVMADLVINIADGERLRNAYQSPFYTRFLFGFKQSLLRKPFVEAAKTGNQVSGKSVFVCLGGADPENRISILMRDVLQHYPEDPIHVVLGSAFVHYEQFFEDYGMMGNVKIHHSLKADEMVHLMRRAKIGFCSSSTIAYEFLCCNDQLVIIRTAANQLNLFDYLHESKVAVPFTDWLKGKNETNRSVLESWRKEMVDYSYPDLFHSIAEETEYYIQEADFSDLELYFEWANDPDTRSQSFNSNPIPFEEHQKWFAEKMGDESQLLLKLKRENESVGQVRFSIEGNTATVNYSLDKKFRGKGLSFVLMKKAIEYIIFHHPEIEKVQGWVKLENVASQKAFLKNAFKEFNDELNEIKVLRYEMDMIHFSNLKL